MTQEETIASHVAGITDSYEAALWVLALNQGHLQEQLVFLIAEPSSSLMELASNTGLATWQQIVKQILAFEDLTVRQVAVQTDREVLPCFLTPHNWPCYSFLEICLSHDS